MKHNDMNFVKNCPDCEAAAAPLEGTPEHIIENVLREIGSITLMGLPEKVGYIFRADLVRAQLKLLAAAVSKNSREELAESEEDLANAIMELRKAEARISELEQRNNKIVEFVNNTWLKNRPDVEEDGYGGGAVNPCLECGLRLMEVVRPGKVQCSLCG